MLVVINPIRLYTCFVCVQLCIKTKKNGFINKIFVKKSFVENKKVSFVISTQLFTSITGKKFERIKFTKKKLFSFVIMSSS